MILVDSRAGSGPHSITRVKGRLSPTTHHYKGLTDYPPLNNPSLACLCTLDSADVCFTGNGSDGPVLIGIELKSIPDLLSSASSGRLQATQIPAMLAQYSISYLLYYGEYRASSDETNNLQLLYGKQWRTYKHNNQSSRPLPLSYLESLLLTLSALGIRIKHVPNYSTAAQWIHILYSWWQKPWDKHKGMRTFDAAKELTEAEYIKISTGDTRQTAIMPGIHADKRKYQCAKTAASLPGIRFERAVALAEHFNGSILDMLNALKDGTEEWEKVPGIGRVIAGAVEKVVK